MGRRARLSGPHRRSTASAACFTSRQATNYSPPATELSDAIVALNLRTGAVKWSRQFTPGDTFSGAFDKDGILAAAGHIQQDRLQRLLAHPYFARPAPKSLDRLTFSTLIEAATAISPPPTAPPR